MTRPMDEIDHLKKVTLEIKVGPSGASEKQFPLVFIYGIGPTGLTDFEYALSGKREGDVFSMDVQHENIPDFFEHLSHAFTDFGEGEGLHLRGRIVKIAEADQREVISAMAELADCGNTCCGKTG